MSDPLRDEVEALRKKIGERTQDRARAHAQTVAGKTQRELTALHRFWFQIVAACHWIYQKILVPVGQVLWKPIKWLWRIFRILWDKIVYVQDEFGQHRFSKTRGGIFLASFAVFVWFVLLPLIKFVFDAGLYFATVRKDEVVYLTNSQEILPYENEHSVQGCHALPCTDENSVYFRIRATPFNEVWSLVNRRALFFPDYVAASVPVSLSTCRITSYGVRAKLLMRGFDIYPDLLRTECAPLNR